MRDTQRTLQHMMLAEKGSSDDDIVQAAVACYAIAQAVQCTQATGNAYDPGYFLRIYMRDGRRGTKLHESFGNPI